MNSSVEIAKWRKAVRADRQFRKALLQWCETWTTVAQAADYMRQHSTGADYYRFLSSKDQVSVVKSVLDSLTTEGLIERAWGPGDKFAEVHTYKQVE